MDFSLNPCAKLPHRGRLGLLVFQDGGCFMGGNPMVVEGGTGKAEAAKPQDAGIGPSSAQENERQKKEWLTGLSNNRVRTRAPELSQWIGPSEVACLLGTQLPDALAPDESHRWESPGSWLDHFRIVDIHQQRARLEELTRSIRGPTGLSRRASVMQLFWKGFRLRHILACDGMSTRQICA
jgi:hypothetical protein